MDKRIKLTLDYIEANLRCTLPLKDLAKIAGMSQSQFHKLFKSCTQRTPFKFIEELKMAKAYQMLMHGDAQVQTVTYSIGYNDYETFSRAFKKYYLLAPDDLKAVAKKLVSADDSTTKELVLMSWEDFSNEDALKEKIQKIIKENNLSLDDLNEAKVYQIHSDTGTKPSNDLIKNKYQITDDQKLWKRLLREIPIHED